MKESSTGPTPRLFVPLGCSPRSGSECLLICDASWGNVSGREIGRYAGLWKGFPCVHTQWLEVGCIRGKQTRLQDVIF
ncbi:hypothetical protein ACKLNR_002656 [Fusarium oxysporum f. sp. zingiberi]